MTRLSERLAGLRSRGRKALAVFLTAGVPARNSTVQLVLDLEKAGADIVEIGLPFSDPLADGPVIQASSALALANGVHLPLILDMVRKVRSRSAVPLVLMGYLNPLLRYGFSRFCTEAGRAGVDGLILPEVPLEEHARFAPALAAAGVDGILLVTPATSPQRIRVIDAASRGFLYCVSMTGVTGGGASGIHERHLRRVKRHAPRNPVLVGFGIAGPADARRAARHADGVIVGSAFLKRLLSDGGREEALRWIAGLRSALG